METCIPEGAFATAMGVPRKSLSVHRPAMVEGEHFVLREKQIAYTSAGMEALCRLMPDFEKNLRAAFNLLLTTPAGAAPAAQPLEPPTPPPSPSPAPGSPETLVSTGRTWNPVRLVCRVKKTGAEVYLRSGNHRLYPSGFEFTGLLTDDPKTYDPQQVPRFPGRM